MNLRQYGAKLNIGAILLIGCLATAACGGTQPNVSPGAIGTTPTNNEETSGGGPTSTNAMARAEGQPQAGEIKDVDSEKYQYVINDKLGVHLGFYVPYGQQEKAGSGGGAGAYYYTGDGSQPTIIVSLVSSTDRGGNTPISQADWFVSDEQSCTDTVVEVPGAVAAARLECPTVSDTIGAIDFFGSAGDLMFQVEVNFGGNDTATFTDVEAAADQLELQVLD